MDGFITEVEHARGVIGERTEAIRRVFAANGVPATSLDPIGEVEHWLDERLPDLRRRSKLAHDTAKLPDWSPGAGGGLVPYEEKSMLPAAEARRLGTDLAAQYKKIDPDVFFDPGLDEKYQKIVDALAAHANDPAFTAAFFASLGLDRTLRLPERLRHALQEGDQSAVDTVSKALGTALSAGGAAVAGLAAISNGMKNKAANHDEQTAIGELLSAGRFPTEWLAQVVATQIFIPGEKAVGSTLTPYLKALARDPGAARLAISLATRDSPLPRDVLAKFSIPGMPSPGRSDQRPDLVTFLKNLNDRSAVDATSADAFGRVLASASGAYDEKDGHHSDPAARFAFTVITTADDLKLSEPTRIHLSEIAGAYATEITEGANLGDANHVLPSAFGSVRSQIPGLKPTFRLSPEDTYKFIKTFADSLDNQMPFQAGMDILTARLIGEGVSDMMKNDDSTRLDDTFAALGNVRGLQLAAREKLGKAVDDAAEEFDKMRSFAIGTGMGLAGLFPPFEGIPITWTALSTAWSAVDGFKPDDLKEVEKIRTADELETLGRQHAIAQALLRSGFKPKISPQEYQDACPPGVSITDGGGRLRPFADILKFGNDGLNALDRWFTENGLDRDKNSLGGTTRFLADRFDGRKDYARNRTHLFDGPLN
ncbi:hypothetical protein DQ384_19955 [Sphaerisporangium album]|uniref:Uncharacterized protein n=2 Tax=Sphaerisporangium album TaxID=509200 RepID=A0A367FG29_9ACTN|nr:hypothetical protein DQ384_19955 [Sphaerisporangium album]